MGRKRRGTGKRKRREKDKRGKKTKEREMKKRKGKWRRREAKPPLLNRITGDATAYGCTVRMRNDSKV